jgi:hypothetical protein
MGLEAANTALDMGSVLSGVGSHAETAGATHGRGERLEEQQEEPSCV